MGSFIVAADHWRDELSIVSLTNRTLPSHMPK
jgi:hypothetical protein